LADLKKKKKPNNFLNSKNHTILSYVVLNLDFRQLKGNCEIFLI